MVASHSGPSYPWDSKKWTWELWPGLLFTQDPAKQSGRWTSVLYILCVYLFWWFIYENGPLQGGAFCLRNLMTRVINPWGQGECQVDWGWKYSLSCNVLYNWVHFIRHFLIFFFPALRLTHATECAHALTCHATWISPRNKPQEYLGWMLSLYGNGMLSEDFRRCSLWFNYVILWELDRRPQFKQICSPLCLLLKINAFFKTTNASLLTRCNIKLPCCKRPLSVDLLIAGKGEPFHPGEGNVEMDILPILIVMTAHFSVYKAPLHALSPLSLITTLGGLCLWLSLLNEWESQSSKVPQSSSSKRRTHISAAQVQTLHTSK